MFVNSGYLIVAKEYPSGKKELRIPNIEVKEEFRTLVAMHASLNNDALNEMFGALIDQDMDEFLKSYRKLIDKHVSYHDVKAENSYHMLFLGMAISVSGMYRITSNIETADGRIIGLIIN